MLYEEFAENYPFVSDKHGYGEKETAKWYWTF